MHSNIPRFLLGNMQQTKLNKADPNMGSYSKQKCSRSWVYSQQFHQSELFTPTKQVRACQVARYIWKSRQSLSGWNNILRSCNCSIFEECEENVWTNRQVLQLLQKWTGFDLILSCMVAQPRVSAFGRKTHFKPCFHQLHASLGPQLS